MLKLISHFLRHNFFRKNSFNISNCDNFFFAQAIKYKKLTRIEVTSSVRGVTYLNGKIFVIKLEWSNILVFNAKSFEHIPAVKVRGDIDTCSARDMTSCRTQQCLYVLDTENKQVHQLREDGLLIANWKSSDARGYVYNIIYIKISC